ncbi:MAG TPA: fumarylacetoacetate hydrolase family protein [Candidatus Binataceae bacterium]|nr:fumarylacetoacetate hydrolase family protein [Candidatus Binataceae bacterium]
MKIVRYNSDGRVSFGALEGASITPLDGALDDLRPIPGVKPLAADAIAMLAPIAPGKIVAVGVNYRDHALEMGRQLPEEPLLFIKPSTAVIASGAAIIYPPQSKLMHFEGELAIVISRTATRVAPERARGYVLGYTCMNDVTARDLQRKDVQFTRGKGFDTFAPLGPVIETAIANPDDLALATRLNGEVRQRSRTSNLIFKCDFLVSYISHIMTLLPGDVISTGTPSGVGEMKPGDTVEVEIEKIGCLRNIVAAPR